MANVGTVESLWRYPVKSMRGEELDEIFVAAAGVAGDRLFAFRSSAAREDFPYFTAREQRHMLRYRPRIRQGAGGPMVDVETPDGDTLAIDDPALIERLRAGADPEHQLSLMRSARPLTDAQPVSIMSVQTANRLAQESSTEPEKRRYRANIYIDLPSTDGFAEDLFVGRSLRIGPSLVVSVLERDVRCMLITLHPDTTAKSPVLLKQIAQLHGGAAGIYGTVLTEGTVRKGDAVDLVD